MKSVIIIMDLGSCCNFNIHFNIHFFKISLETLLHCLYPIKAKTAKPIGPFKNFFNPQKSTNLKHFFVFFLHYV